MKKTILFGIIFFPAITFAQTKFGIFGGPQHTDVEYVINGEKQITEQKNGYQAGISLKFPLEKFLYFAPALYYSKKGYKVVYSQPSNPPDIEAINNNTEIHSVDLALLLNIDFSGSRSHIFLKFGPSVEYIVSGKEQFDLRSGGSIEKEMTRSFTGNYMPITASGIAHLGYQAKFGLFIFGHFAYGIGNLSNQQKGPKIHHRIAGVSLGMNF
jgi:hypothetical protein